MSAPNQANIQQDKTENQSKMSEYFIGIDSGTQSTKAILLDAASGAVAASASQSYEMIEGLPAGHKEQHPREWIDATRATIKTVLDKSGIDRAQVKGIGVSGQQHGFVPLDANDQVIRPAKLWCDTATSAECEAIIANLGGLDATIAAVGNGIPAGFTASKILWLKNHEPENYARLASVLLPHDYLNFWLTGAKTMECGDASGTALLDVRACAWSDAAINAIDPRVKAMLPRLIASDEIAGQLRAELANEFGLSSSVIVSSGAATI